MIKQKATYICDICGEEIKDDLYNSDLVTLSYEVASGNGWNIDVEKKEKHVHKIHLIDVLCELEKGGK